MAVKNFLLTKESQNEVAGSKRKETPRPTFHISYISYFIFIYALSDLSLKPNAKYFSHIMIIHHGTIEKVLGKQKFELPLGDFQEDSRKILKTCIIKLIFSKVE